jgi:hypothetical protein
MSDCILCKIHANVNVEDPLDTHGTRLACVTERLRRAAWRRDDGALAGDAPAACDVAVHGHAAVERRADLPADLAEGKPRILGMYRDTHVPALALDLILSALQRDDDSDAPRRERDTAEVAPW